MLASLVGVLLPLWSMGGPVPALLAASACLLGAAAALALLAAFGAAGGRGAVASGLSGSLLIIALVAYLAIAFPVFGAWGPWLFLLAAPGLVGTSMIAFRSGRTG